MLLKSNVVTPPVGYGSVGVHNILMVRLQTDLWGRNAKRYSPVPNILVSLKDEPYSECEEHGQGINWIDSCVVVVVCGSEEESMNGVPDSRENRIHFLAACSWSVARRTVTRFNQARRLGRKAVSNDFHVLAAPHKGRYKTRTESMVDAYTIQ